MLRKLLIITCLLGTVTAFAQKDDNRPPGNKPRMIYTKFSYKDIGSPMPDVRIAILDPKDTGKTKRNRPARIVTDKDLNNKANLIMMLFNPECSHCEEQTEVFEKNISMFDKSKLLMIASSTMGDYLPAFLKGYHIDQYPTIIAGIDSSGLIDKLFDYKLLPQINIYDKDRKLIKCYYGGVVMDSLKRYIE